MPWYSGNMHCHTSNSDGRSNPQEVTAYYQSIGMDFLAITDHNHLTPLEEYGNLDEDKFIGIPSSEYSGKRACHVVGFDLAENVRPVDNQEDWSVRDILADGMNQILEGGGVPILCHPGFQWAYDHETILELERATHFEVVNMHPGCNSRPVPCLSYGEEVWDKVLSAGKRCFGTVSDDGHFYGTASEFGAPPLHIPLAGTGWNVVKAAELTPSAIRDAFAKGRFYGSTGIDLAYYQVTYEDIRVGVTLKKKEQVIIEFIGENGKLLDLQSASAGRYKFKGDEKYVRVRVSDTMGGFAFTQPVFLDDLAKTVEWTSQP